MIEGNPLPSLRANVTYSQMASLELAGDTVMITDGKMDYRVNVTCIAYNGVSPTATASVFVHFGSKHICITIHIFTHTCIHVIYQTIWQVIPSLYLKISAYN